MCQIKKKYYYCVVLNHTSGKLVVVSVCVPLSVGGVGGGCIVMETRNGGVGR